MAGPAQNSRVQQAHPAARIPRHGRAGRPPVGAAWSCGANGRPGFIRRHRHRFWGSPPGQARDIACRRLAEHRHPTRRPRNWQWDGQRRDRRWLIAALILPSWHFQNALGVERFEGVGLWRTA